GALLASIGGVDPEVAPILVAGTRGNPLALLELPELLTAGQLSGAEPLSEPLPVSEALESGFGGQLPFLPAATQRALLMAAVSHTGDIAVLLRALAEDGLDARALDAAQEAG